MKRSGIILLVVAILFASMASMTTVAAATSIKVQMFNGGLTDTVNTLNPCFNLVNTGTDVITLSNVKIRYYFTNDGTQADNFACDWATAGNGNVTAAFADVTGATNADRYCEISFTSAAGTLAAGASTEVRPRIWKSDWSNFTQSNDYSFNSTATSYTDTTKVTGYISGSLVCGTEPGETGVTNTPTPTPTPTATPTGSTATPTPTPAATATPTPTPGTGTGRQMENLDRGVVAVKVSNGVFVSWRVLGTEASSVSYNLYRSGTKLTNITGASNYVDTAGTTSSTYSVSAVVNGTEQAQSAAVSVWGQSYLSVPLQIPAGGTTPDGVAYTYSANDCSVGDLDGDHQYEIIVKWDPSNSKDNSQSGYTGNVFLDAYKLNGTRLWRIDLGRNIRAGAHYTQFQVYDLDGDGKAEVACKTADGTKDGKGTVIGSSSADYRSSAGYILTGPEFLTIFNGQTGAALSTINYEPARGTVSSWGDDYGNRVDRFLACVAYLDGSKPSLVMCRGYYTRAVLVAYDWRNGSLTKRWTFDSNTSGNSGYAGQGNHNLSVADVDSDGKDEIVYGACCINDNGTGLYTTGLGHGDAMHVSDMDPSRPGLEVWDIHETANSASGGGEFRDAKTGQLIWGYGTASGTDTGRGMASDIDSRYSGFEMWSTSTNGVYSANHTLISTTKPSVNFAIWWDGDLSRELLDGTKIDKWNNGTITRLLTPSECTSNNSTKANPCLSGDILGDWREEGIWRTTDSTALHIYTTTATTTSRIYTLMHDSQYRVSIAWQNTAYNQPPHTGFFLGTGMSAAPTPNIYLAP